LSEIQPSTSGHVAAGKAGEADFDISGPQATVRAPAGGGDPLALLFQKYREALMRFFARRLGSGSDVEDTVQQVFLRVVKESRKRPIRNPRALLYVAASNIVKDERRRRRARWVEQRELPDEEMRCSRPQPEQVAADRQEMQLLLAALKELETKYKRAFVLHRFDNLTYDQIAVEMGISVSSVQNYISLVMAHLRTRLRRTV
jgi:RNA polymerase sigma-70 factor (ECF subfamily)